MKKKMMIDLSQLVKDDTHKVVMTFRVSQDEKDQFIAFCRNVLKKDASKVLRALMKAAVDADTKK